MIEPQLICFNLSNRIVVSQTQSWLHEFILGIYSGKEAYLFLISDLQNHHYTVKRFVDNSVILQGRKTILMKSSSINQHLFSWELTSIFFTLVINHDYLVTYSINMDNWLQVHIHNNFPFYWRVIRLNIFG